MPGPSLRETSSRRGLGNWLVVPLTSRGSTACGLAVRSEEESEGLRQRNGLQRLRTSAESQGDPFWALLMALEVRDLMMTDDCHYPSDNARDGKAPVRVGRSRKEPLWGHALRRLTRCHKGRFNGEEGSNTSDASIPFP